MHTIQAQTYNDNGNQNQNINWHAGSDTKDW